MFKKLALTTLSLLLVSGCATNKHSVTSKPGAPGTAADFNHNVGQTVYFAYDSSALCGVNLERTKEQAKWLNTYHHTNVVLGGHCDERGTRAYNFGLGERRAHAVKAMYVKLGVAPNRVKTVSFGKERPAAIGTGEKVWAQNRRTVATIKE